MRSRRALLYMPGDDWKKITKALTLGVDCICMDMEDGTAVTAKPRPAKRLPAPCGNWTSASARNWRASTASAAAWKPTTWTPSCPTARMGLSLPKAETPEQVNWVSEKIESAELKYGWPVNSIRMILVVESAKGILNLKELAAHPRLDALIFGAEDFCASVGATRTPEALEVLYARSALVTAAAAFGLQAIDLVTVDFRDSELARREAFFGAQLGYSGKQIIHPGPGRTGAIGLHPRSKPRLPTPSRIVATFEIQSIQRNAGAYDLDGKMIDLPLLKAAQNTL
jgi:citrate lyase beta subunit